MPPNRHSSQDTFYIRTLDPQVLGAPGGLDAALRAIEATCHRGDPEIAGVVAALNGHSYILEYIVSGTL